MNLTVKNDVDPAKNDENCTFSIDKVIHHDIKVFSFMTEEIGDKPRFLTTVKSPRYFASIFQGRQAQLQSLSVSIHSDEWVCVCLTGNYMARWLLVSVSPDLSSPPSLFVCPLPLELFIFPKRT